MRIAVVAPSERLAPFIRRFTVIETQVEATRTLLPERGAMLGIRLEGTATLIHPTQPPPRAAAGSEPASRGAARTMPLPDATLTGVVGAARRIHTTPGVAVFAAFRETGAARFFAEPMHELFGRTVALDEVTPRTELERARARMADAPDHRRRVAILEEFLLARLRSDRADPVADAAAAAIARCHGALRISQLSRELGISLRPLENHFRRAVGTSPKQFASLVRLHRVIDARRSGASWSRLALEAGYCDQPHFNREFRAFTGESPRTFFQRGTFCALPLAPPDHGSGAPRGGAEGHKPGAFAQGEDHRAHRPRGAG